MDKGNKISKNFKTYSDYFHKEARKLRKGNKKLKEKKASIGNQTIDHMKQLDMFQNLRRLLQVKEVCQKKSIEQKKIDEDKARLEVDGRQSLDITQEGDM
jgi:hypothetical protein